MRIAVSASHVEQEAEARRLAQELDLPWQLPDTDRQAEVLLELTPQRLHLRETGKYAAGPVFAEFESGASAYRRKHGGGRKQALGRAVGLKSGYNPLVVDVTAGLGGDSFVLASLGCTVWMVERSALIAALLRDGLRRAAANPELAATLTRMHLYQADARVWLADLPASRRPDVVYLDPMYPERRKTALNKKEMRLFRELVGTDPDATDLLEQALTRARRRVVVKRPRHAPALGCSPTGCIEGRSTRFDIYIDFQEKI